LVESVEAYNVLVEIFPEFAMEKLDMVDKLAD
jgi:hypothetical protein